MPIFTCTAVLSVTAEDEYDAADQIADSGFSSGALFGTVQIDSLDLVEQESE